MGDEGGDVGEGADDGGAGGGDGRGVEGGGELGARPAGGDADEELAGEGVGDAGGGEEGGDVGRVGGEDDDGRGVEGLGVGVAGYADFVGVLGEAGVEALLRLLAADAGDEAGECQGAGFIAGGCFDQAGEDGGAEVACSRGVSVGVGFRSEMLFGRPTAAQNAQRGIIAQLGHDGVE